MSATPKTLYDFACLSGLKGRAFCSSPSPLAREAGVPQPKGVVSTDRLTYLSGDTAEPLPPSAPSASEEQERIRLQVIETLQFVLKDRPREEIAAEAGYTVHQIGGWTSPSSGKNVSLASAIHLSKFLERPDLLEAGAAEIGYWLANEQERADAALGRRVREAVQAIAGELAA